MIFGAWLLRLYAENLASVHNCPGWRVFHVLNMEEDQTAKLSAEIRDDLLLWCDWRRRSEMISCRDCLLRSWSLWKGKSSEMIESIGATQVEVSSRGRAASRMTLKWWWLLVGWTHVIVWRSDLTAIRTNPNPIKIHKKIWPNLNDNLLNLPQDLCNAPIPLIRGRHCDVYT